MEDAALTDAPERDREEIERYIESHGGAIVLRVGDKIGSDAKAAMLAHRKQHGELPPFDHVWIGESTLGRESSAAAVDGAGSVTRSGHHEAVGERQGRQPALFAGTTRGQSARALENMRRRVQAPLDGIEAPAPTIERRIKVDRHKGARHG